MRVLGYIAFDLETDGLLPEEQQQGLPPPEVNCGVTQKMHRAGEGFVTETSRRWVPEGFPDFPDGKCSWDASVLCALVDYLQQEREMGYLPASWNGTGFDFRVLHALICRAEGLPVSIKSRYGERVKVLAMAGVDAMFNFFMHKGFPVAMKRVADGFDLAMNKSGDGVAAVEAWKGGKAADREWVVAYCERDVAVLAMIISAIDATGEIRWITKAAGRRAGWSPSDKTRLLMPTSEAMLLPQPDNRWMNKPKASDPNTKDSLPSLEKFVGWINHCGL